MKILILSAAIGGGHMQAAYAIKESLLNAPFNAEAVIVDAFEYINPLLSEMIINSYLGTIKHTPKIYELLYDLSSSSSKANHLKKMLNTIFSDKVKKIINTHQPDIIICTHSFPLMVVSMLKGKGIINIPVMAVITDYTVHSSWINPHVNAYITGDNTLKFYFKENHIITGQNIIYPLGIPVESKFNIPVNRKEIQNKHHLNNHFTVILMGGSLGLGEIEDIFDDILRSSMNIQLIAVTGKNEVLKNTLIEHNNELNTNVNAHILGFTNKMSELMSIANLIVSKPGGLSATEAIIKHVPMIIPSYIPGQEEENTEFLLNNGLALKAKAPFTVRNLIAMCLEDDTRLKEIQNTMHRFAKPHAAEDIAALIKKMVEGKE